eukprot:gene20582-31696_t
MSRVLRVLRLGKREYVETLRLQKELLAKRKAGDCPDTVILVEHDPAVYTLGRREIGASDLLVKEDEINVVRVDRGGRATWHGPGQLTVYPIVNFKQLEAISARKRCGSQGLVHWWVSVLEESVIRLVNAHGLAAWTCSDVGVWVGGPIDPADKRQFVQAPGVAPCGRDRHGRKLDDAVRTSTDHGPERKIAAIGVQLSNYCSMHGVAVNVTPDLEQYRKIVPCGLQGRAVTSLAHEIPSDAGNLTIPAVGDRFIDAFVESVTPTLPLEIVECTLDTI